MNQPKSNQLLNNFVDKIKASGDGSVLPPRQGGYSYLAFIDKSGPEMIYIYDTHKKAFKQIKNHDDEFINSLWEKLSKIDSKMHYFHTLELPNGCLSCIVGTEKLEFRLPYFMRYENQEWFNQYRTQIALDAFVQSDYRLLNFGGYDPNRQTSLRGCAIYGEGPWRLIPGMHEKRSEHALVFYDSVAFALGGQNETDVLKSCESIQVDPIGDKWSAIEPMINVRQGHKALGLFGKIFVVGGYSTRRGAEPSKDLVMKDEVYDVVSNTWKEFKGTGLHCVCLKTCNGIIYGLMSQEPTWKKKSFQMMVLDPQSLTWRKEMETTLDSAVKFCYSCNFSKSDILKI